MNMCKEILSAVPKSVLATFAKGRHTSLAEALERLKTTLGDKYYENSAMNTVLVQEISRYNKLLGTIHKSIKELMRALKGEIMISKDSENIYNSFLTQKIPHLWNVNLVLFDVLNCEFFILFY